MPDRRDRPRRSDGPGEDRPMYSGPRQPRKGLDEEVVALRDRGKSYSAVARTLGMKRATDAQAAFVRGMRSLPEDQRRALSKRESERFDQLEVRIRTRDAAELVKMERHLAALQTLRETMLL